MCTVNMPSGIYTILFIVVITNVLQLIVAYFIHERSHRLFCMVVAGITCLQYPLGTVLGVISLYFFIRKDVMLIFCGEGEDELNQAHKKMIMSAREAFNSAKYKEAIQLFSEATKIAPLDDVSYRYFEHAKKRNELT